jgi:aldose 1-epimerase
MPPISNCYRTTFCIAVALAAIVCWRASSTLRALAAAAAVNSQGKQASAGKSAESAPDLEIGGQPPIELKRKPGLNPSKPEFTSVTILPGRGMNLFQITANVPGKGEVNVLASPSLEEAAHVLDGGEGDAHGVKSFSFGGAFLIPYPNRIRGALSADHKDIETHWHGKTLTLPAAWKGKNPNAEPHAIHGLILDRKTDQIQVRSIPDGEEAIGVIKAGNFGGYWLSKTELRFNIALAGKSVEATIVATNVGDQGEPMSIGWHPYFAIPSGDRSQARLEIPASKLAEVNNYDDVFPTGKLLSVTGTKYDFTAPGGRPLRDIYMDDNFSGLSRTGGGVVVNLTDPASHYGIHIGGLSPEIRTLQVYAPPDKAFAVVEDQFNFADPFSAVWRGMDTGMVTLQPGQSVTWKVRLELFRPRH